MDSRLSFRDPTGFVFRRGQRLLRCVTAAGFSECDAFLRAPSAQRFLADQRLVGTRLVAEAEVEECLSSPMAVAPPGAEAGSRFLEHDLIWFPSYAYEWPPEMLHDAGRLTLELARESLADGFGLKDASPYNILFRGPRPVFIDVPSFEPRAPGDPMWKPYAQFVRTFVLPLLACRYWGKRPTDIFLTRRDGLEPEEVYPWCGFLQKLRPPFLFLVSLPVWLSRRANRAADASTLYQERTLEDAAKARFILESLLGRLGRQLDRLRPNAQPASHWSAYMGTHSYSEVAFNAKQEFVTRALDELKPRRVLDVGANTGHFSALAARAGAQVVAIDYDAACVGTIWRRARAEQLDILPLVVDLARPTPALGWRYRECPSFLDRAQGAFDLMLMLAVIHHLLVTERVPLENILGLVAQLTTDAVVVEFVAPQDEMFRRLTRGRDHLHADLSPALFEAACAREFQVVRSQRVADTHRWLYLLRKRGGTR